MVLENQFGTPPEIGGTVGCCQVPREISQIPDDTNVVCKAAQEPSEHKRTRSTTLGGCTNRSLQLD